MSEWALDELEELRVRAAHAEALQSALREVLDFIKQQGGYMKPEHQALLRRARAVLLESEGAP